MDARIALHAQLLDANVHLARKAVAGLSDEELWRRPGERSNSVGWLLGHIVATRYGMVALLGGNMEKPSWTAAFQRGQTYDRPTDGPGIDELVEALGRTGAAIRDTLEKASDEQLSAVSPFKFPIPDDTVRGAVAFFGFHETYHVGQLAYLRKWLGYEGLVG
jgi:uncharacterized damage-inducible protein DinB